MTAMIDRPQRGMYNGQPVTVLDTGYLRTSKHNSLPISHIRFRGSRADCWVLSSEVESERVGAMTHRSVDRDEFLRDLLRTAVYHFDYGWFDVLRYKDGEGRIRDRQTGEEYDVTTETMVRGLRIIKTSVAFGGKDRVNSETGEKLGFDGKDRDAMVQADRTNGRTGSYDVITALKVLECGLFGKVVYT